MIQYMLLLSITSILWWRKNIIMMLISLEIMLISMFTLMPTNSFNFNPLSLMFMLTIMVSGSAMGLSLMVAMTRTHKSSMSMYIWNLTFDKIYLTINYNPNN